MELTKDPNTFFDSAAVLIEQARRYVGRTADLTMCITYFELGRMIIEEEQGGQARAQYGRGLLAELSIFLNSRFKKGFSETNLRNARKYFLTYQSAIQQLSTAEFESKINTAQLLSTTTMDKNGNFRKQQLATAELDTLLKYWRSVFKLSWTHYVVLMRIGNEQERRFYEIEAIKQQWSVAELKRQYHSSLYERLALSREKDEVLRLANEGYKVEKTSDILKSPLILEFLGLDETSKYTESDLETAIINKLQKFLLELGKGFLFEARQKRFSFDEKHFYVDLVFYNRLLKCYVLIDLKTTELKHQDLGQMQMYVNYFDRHVKEDAENPTIGILLSKEQNNSVVEMTLPKDANIYSTAYSLYLPDKTVLQEKLAEWVEEFEEVKELLETAEEI